MTGAPIGFTVRVVAETTNFTFHVGDEDYEYMKAISLLTGRPMAEFAQGAVHNYIRQGISTVDALERQNIRHISAAAETLRQWGASHV